MATKKSPTRAKAAASVSDLLGLRKQGAIDLSPNLQFHKFGNCVCHTDARGFATPQNRSPISIRLDASEGFIPLWAKDSILRWRFQARALSRFANPEGIKQAIETVLGNALVSWGDAAPVKFSKREDAWDFEIVMKSADDCDASGCVLASAFFPDTGRHELIIYPKMFEQSPQEQIETLAHELGHVFGLRHFFANVSETAWPSELFGKNRAFSIMNYGEKSKMTADDRKDLKKLYKAVWNGTLTAINTTPIKLVKPFHTLGGVQ
jgi:Metallo-peptidase family M12B Reprolysin-like